MNGAWNLIPGLTDPACTGLLQARPAQSGAGNAPARRPLRRWLWHDALSGRSPGLGT